MYAQFSFQRFLNFRIETGKNKGANANSTHKCNSFNNCSDPGFGGTQLGSVIYLTHSYH